MTNHFSFHQFGNAVVFEDTAESVCFGFHGWLWSKVGEVLPSESDCKKWLEKRRKLGLVILIPNSVT